MSAGVPRAHPRSRGENTHGGSQFSAITGSSPLTRGKLDRRSGRPVNERLIPAHAGKTRARARGLGCWWAHPRSCGENGLAATSCSRVLGSSPLTRGKLARTQTGTTLTRITPAHAGKTSIRRRLRRTSRAHPRSRGENLLPTRSIRTLGGSSPLTRGKRSRGTRMETHSGSSPLTRGKLARESLQRAFDGLIPAYAGKTTQRCWTFRHPRAHPRSCGENT